ncbi:MAG: Na/Pi cotransporter family protein [Clostridiales bacterium]|nr:Na/Pi cotransporter family protein [Clostridiales bacterium]
MGTVFILMSGLLLFLGGLRLMTAGLEKMGGTTFAANIRRFTENRISAFLCGLIFTALTQSSSLTTVIVVSVAEAGLIPLAPAIAVIIGANVGTTVTGQLLSFQLQNYALPLAGAGMLMLAAMPQGRGKDVGRTLTGLGVLLFGLKTMGAALAPLSETALFGAVLLSASYHPLSGILAGAAVTALLQSSSAVVGMILLLAQNGMLTLAAGVSLIIGADVGTCVTSLLAGLGTGVTARRAALAHLLFNVFSVLLILPMFYTFVDVAASISTTLPRQLANAHTIYNGCGALLLLLFLKPFQCLVEWLTVPENKDKKRISAILSEIIARWF